MKVGILGVGSTRFSEHWDKSLRDLALSAACEALTHSPIGFADIDAIFVGNMSAGLLAGQEHIGALVSSELGLTVPAMRVEGACASGSLALQAGIFSILSGQARYALIVGVEKMSDLSTSQVTSVLMNAADEELEGAYGFTFPSLYALMAQAYMKRYKITEEIMAEVAVKNHYHGSLNPLAQFRNVLTVKDVMNSSYISDPLKLLDCSPISDGASAVVLCREDLVTGPTLKQVFVVASTTSTDFLALHRRSDITSIPAAYRASKKAFEMAGVTQKDIDLVEVHDCFTIAEYFALEDMGFFEKGAAPLATQKGLTRLGGILPVNVSGGLKACGHPVGATGVRKAFEITLQLRGEAGDRQVHDARIALSHNVGGSGATAVVNIFARGDFFKDKLS